MNSSSSGEHEPTLPRSRAAPKWDRRGGARSERVNLNAGNITASRQSNEALAPSHAGRAVSKPMSGGAD